MKTLLALAMPLLAASAVADGATRSPTDAELEARIVTLDEQGWEAWKHNDASWFVANTTEDFQSLSSSGIAIKAEVVRGIPTDCRVASYSLADFRFTRLDENAVLLTYTATQDAVCGGEKAPTSLRVAVNYVRRDGKWLEAMYMQAP